MSDWDEESEAVVFAAISQSEPRNRYADQRRDFHNRKDRQQINQYHDHGQKSVRSNVTRILIHPDDCGRLIGKGGSKIQELQEQSSAKIKVCRDDGDHEGTPVVIFGDHHARENAKTLIENFLSEYQQTNKTSYKTDSNGADEYRTSEGFINWSKVNRLSKEQSEIRWGKLTPIKKNFYIEDEDIADMMPKEVALWRENNFDLTVKDTSEENRRPLNPVLTFEQAFSHYPDILTEIYKQKFTTPTPIQAQMWPLLLSGFDTIGIAQTGTGKTLAFLLPIFIHIDLQDAPRNERGGPSAVILTPTRELALQIEREVKKYHYRGIRCLCVYGGGDQSKQIKAIASGVEIVVATPGRMNDLMSCDLLSLESVTFLVLDEADRMLDMGFEPQIGKILLDVRPDRQTVMTSATWPSGVVRMASRYLRDPFHITVGSLDLAATHTVQQVIEIIAEDDKQDRLIEFVGEMEKDDKAIVFVGRKLMCDAVVGELLGRGVQCHSMHGGLEQYDRERALEDFANGYVKVLVATDLASRGLDVKDITHVFNYDFPRNIEEYVHRVGRTGRAGNRGIAISLVTRNDWGGARKLIEILEEAEQEVPIELEEMAQRFEQMKKRREEERSGGYQRRDHDRGGRNYDRGRGRGGRRGGRFGMDVGFFMS